MLVKRKLYFTFWLFLCITQALFAQNGQNFQEAKKVAKGLWHEHRETFYCGCAYDKHGIVDFKSCSYAPTDLRKDKTISWEHVVPVSWYGKKLACWNKPLCVSKRGKKYKGRKCCQKISPLFRQMESDLHNLVPAIHEVNARRENYRFAQFDLDIPEKHYFNGCPIIIDERYRLVEPPDSVKGMVARISLYMADKYGIDLGERQHRLLTDWNHRYPVSFWEKRWNHKVTSLMGTSNYYIEKGQPE